MKYCEAYQYHLLSGTKMRRSNWAKDTYIQLDTSAKIGHVTIFFVNSKASNAWQWIPNRNQYITDDLTTENWGFYDE